MQDSIYNQKAWIDKFILERPADRFEEERVRTILSAIPPDVEKALDVGIGSGRIYRELKKRKGLESFGVDISRELVEAMGDPSVTVASAKGLPFEDGAFDLVLAADVLEHIGEEDFAQSISEIARVSRRYILINGPYRDVIEWPVSLCGSCKKEFNIYGHVRRLDADLLKNVFSGYGFEVAKSALIGAKRDPRPLGLVRLARRYGKVYSNEGAVCPYCLSAELKELKRNAAEKVIGRSICAVFFLMDRLIPPGFKQKGEICMLYRKADHA